MAWEHEKASTNASGAARRSAQSSRSLWARAARCDVGLAPRERRRVEHQQVVAASVLPQEGEGIRRHELRRQLRRTGGEIAPRDLERGRRGVDERDAGRAAVRGRHREAAAVGEEIEHAPARRQALHEIARVALIEIEAGLLAVDQVDLVAPAALADRDRAGRRLAPERLPCRAAKPSRRAATASSRA